MANVSQGGATTSRRPEQHHSDFRSIWVLFYANFYDRDNYEKYVLLYVCIKFVFPADVATTTMA